MRLKGKEANLNTELLNVGLAANRHKHAVSLDLLGSAALSRLNAESDVAVALLRGRGDLGAHAELYALLLKQLLELRTSETELR